MFENKKHQIVLRSSALCPSDAVLCSQSKRGALRRQPHIDQHTQARIEDPWVRLADRPPEEVLHHHPAAADRTHPTTMSDQENTPEVNGTHSDVTSDPPSDMTPENTCETPPGEKTAPPVAPKPAWFRQSLRKIRNEQGQKKQDKPAELRSVGGFTRTYGGRSASSSANLSIKQKIHSFETFSSAEVSEKEGNRRPSATSTSISTSLPLEESRSRPASHGDSGRGQNEIQEEIQEITSPCDSEPENPPVFATPSAIPSSTFEACSQTAAGDDPLSIQPPADLPLCDSTDLHSGTHGDPPSAPLPAKQEAEIEEDLTSSNQNTVSPPATSMISQEGGESLQEEGDGAENQGKPLSPTLSAAPPAGSHHQRGLEEGSLEKILAFSNQVICQGRTMVMDFMSMIII